MECTAPGVNPNVSDGLGAVTMCQRRFTDETIPHPGRGDGDDAGGYAWGVGGGNVRILCAFVAVFLRT